MQRRCPNMLVIGRHFIYNIDFNRKYFCCWWCCDCNKKKFVHVDILYYTVYFMYHTRNSKTVYHSGIVIQIYEIIYVLSAMPWSDMKPPIEILIQYAPCFKFNVYMFVELNNISRQKISKQ